MLRCTILLLTMFGVASVLSTPRNGRYISADSQCKSKGYQGVCINSAPADRCWVMWCAEHQGSNKLPRRKFAGAALPFTKCGLNKVCVNSQCVADRNLAVAGNVVVDEKEMECID